MELLNRIDQEGEQKAQRIRDEAEDEAQRRREAAEREIAGWREQALEDAKARIENEKRLIISRARAQARSTVLRAKAEAARALYDRLTEEAERLRDDADAYKRFLASCLQEAESEIGGELVLAFDERDQAIFEQLLADTNHQTGESIATIGGFIATSASGDLLVDNRLETRIENLIRQHRPELSAQLFQN
jgi:vacuolar-type H+-ATPase subunit E/Vma4